MLSLGVLTSTKHLAVPLLICSFIFEPVTICIRNKYSIYAGHPNWMFEIILHPLQVSSGMNHGSHTFWLRERNLISCSGKINSMNNAWLSLFHIPSE